MTERRVEDDKEEINGVDDLQDLLVIEEAHRLLANPGPRASEEQADPRGQAVETFTNLLAEIRAYGQGVIIVDQVPVKLAPEVMKNTSLKIAHQMVAMDDRAALAGAMAMTERQAEALAVLEPGLAAVFGEGDDAPVLVRIPQVKGLPDDSHPDRVRVAEEMSRTPALAPCRALFTPLGGALELHTPAARSAVDIARRLSQEPAVQADFVRLVLSMLEDDTALDRLWPQVQTHAHALHKRGDDLPALLRCLAVYLSTWLAQRRGAQAQWTYAETARYDAALRALLLAQLAGQDTGPALVTYRELAVRLHARTFSPFPWCEQICPHQPSASLYRYAVADQFTSADLVRAWQQALEQDGGLAGPQAWQVCQDVAQQLLEWVPTQNAALRSVGLCFAQQMLSANSSLLPETRSAALAQLFVLAETPVVADGK